MLNIEAIKEIRVPIGITIGAIACLWYAKAWADKEYVTSDDFAKKSQEISLEISGVSSQITALVDITEDHVEEFRISEATQVVREAKRDLVMAEISNATPDQKRYLAEQVSKAEQYKQCLVNRQPNCRHILE